MKRLFCFLILIVVVLTTDAQIKIACVGASITEGAGIKNPKEYSYPGQLQSLLGVKYRVENFGVGGTTLLKNGNHPYRNTEAFRKAQAYNPDIVFVDLGGNDAKLVNRKFYGEFENDARELIREFKQLPSRPRVIVLMPTVFFVTDADDIYDPVCRREIVPRLQRAALAENVEALDLHTLLIDRPDLIPDKIHPLEKGAEIIAKRLFRQLSIRFDDEFDIFKILKKKNIDFRTSDFAGYECADFDRNGRSCKVVKPRKTAADRPWIWRARFWGHEPQTDVALLELGYHLVYCDQSERLGNRQCIEEWNGFHGLLTDEDRGLNRKAVLEGMSRGAVYALNWAAANPDKVAAVYIDNPLLDMKSAFFGPDGGEKPENEITRGIRESFGVERDNAASFDESPIDKTDAIVRGNYPILILCAELDEAAVNSQNTFPFERKIREKGGNITVIVKQGAGHHPHSLPNPARIVDFVEKARNPDAFLSSAEYDSYKGLSMAGYQGWFSCPDDGSERGWYHYCGRNGVFRPGTCTIDMWPDVSEYDRVYGTEFVFADGRQAHVMSSYDESTVRTHFRWMREYGVDGVFVQRFVAEIKRPLSLNQLNKVWHSAINAANANNRAIAVMYDLSGMLPGDERLILSDIDSIAAKYDIHGRRDNQSYLRHNGKPLVAVWGVGFSDNRRYGFVEAETIIDSLVARGFSILIGVPTNWRMLEKDASRDATLHRLIRRCDIVMPWLVGRFNENTFAPYANIVKQDMQWCRENGVDYAPLTFPGFSWVNMNENSTPIPRNRGSFYWKQFSTYISLGAEMFYLAMFDEIDEGTAIFKCAADVPTGESYFLPSEKDLGNDHYLWIAGRAAKMLRKEIPFAEKLPPRKFVR